MVYRMMNSERIVIPCMNNKLLFLNMQNIKEIILLDEACDQPEYVNWDYHVDCGEFPLVIYDALEDYMYCEDVNGAEILINMKNVSMLELPLLKVEKAISENEI